MGQINNMETEIKIALNQQRKEKMSMKRKIAYGLAILSIVVAGILCISLALKSDKPLAPVIQDQPK